MHTSMSSVQLDRTAPGAVGGQPAESALIESSAAPPVSILLVDDNLANLRVLSRLLDREGYKVRPVPSGAQALSAIEAAPPDLILLDIRMPEMDGYEVCQRIKANEKFSAIPIIFISAADALEDKIRGFEVGGVDYITKPFQELEVMARVAAHVQIYQLQRTLNDKIADLEKANGRILELSTRDELTKLYNRRYFNQQADRLFAQADRYQQPLSLAIGDVDFFKKVNDTFSHAVGDKVLRGVAQVLQKSIRETDLCARYGGEEFVIAFPGVSLAEAVQACNKVRLAIAAAPWDKIHPDLKVTMSIGVCDDLSLGSYEQVIAAADEKLYEAKHSGRNRVCA